MEKRGNVDDGINASFSSKGTASVSLDGSVLRQRTRLSPASANKEALNTPSTIPLQSNDGNPSKASTLMLVKQILFGSNRVDKANHVPVEALPSESPVQAKETGGKMNQSMATFLIVIFTLNLLIGNGFHLYVDAAGVPYDYSYKLEQPETPLYNGGILENPEFNKGLKGWKAGGNAIIELGSSDEDNYYAIASNLTQTTGVIAQTISAEEGKHYSVSAWIQVRGQREARVEGAAKTNTTSIIDVGWVFAKNGCWKMLKGGFVADSTEYVDFQFQVLNASATTRLWVDSISVQPFTQEEWTAHVDQSFQRVRTRKLKLEAVDFNGKAVANASVSIKQLKPNFPFGGLLNQLIIDNPPYQKWFLERFTHAVFENELKWSFDESVQGVENYTIPDAMLEFANANGLITRGHNIVWDVPNYMLPWMKALSPHQLREAAVNRINSVVGRYLGQFIHWDVVNENMHGDAISKVFPGKSRDIFRLTHEIDPQPVLFLNEYNVIESTSVVAQAGPPVFLAKIEELRSGGYDGPLGIGLQCHFNDQAPPNIPYMRAALDMFAATGLPVWATEFTVGNMMPTLPLVMPLLRELHSHPAVEGILLWSAVNETGGCFYKSACLTDAHYNNIPYGDVVDDFMHQFIRIADSSGTTDCDGVFEASLVYGEYEANITRANYTESLLFSLLPNTTTVALKVNM